MKKFSLDKADIDKVLEGMILSASGWRGVFAAGGEEGREETVSEAHSVITAAAAEAFAGYLRGLGPGRPRIILGMDTRPTGKAIAGAMITVLLAGDCEIRFISIAAAPEIMAYARIPAANGEGGPQGFIFISASHNPIGHNGIKFGLTDGGVLEGAETLKLTERFRSLLSSPEEINRIRRILENGGTEAVQNVFALAEQVKKEAYRAYLDFSSLAAFGAGDKPPLETVLKEGLRERPIGIVCDFNGSARSASIDKEFFSSLGIRLYAINDVPGGIKHRIVPEGESLEPCRKFLEDIHKTDPSAVLGYMPDCDGDRGNLVIWDKAEGRARILEAQEVFALACVAELAHLVWTGELCYDNKGNALSKAALAVNDPTSLRINRIASAFDVSVFRAETGEANVVGLARRLRNRGYTVRILGEGSNGGNITHPSAVRDPLSTILSLLKLLTVRSAGGKMGFYEIWCDLSNRAETYRPVFGLEDIIASLPSFVTTGAYSPEGLLKVKTADHGLLKDRYQEIFLRDWEERKDELKARYGITGWEAAAYNGMEERRGISRFGDAGRGGLKILFSGGGNPLAAIWMRGSATEPVFRVMADAEGRDKRLERTLIDWQRRMVAEADARNGGE
jgi:phosphoglucomutase